MVGRSQSENHREFFILQSATTGIVPKVLPEVACDEWRVLAPIRTTRHSSLVTHHSQMHKLLLRHQLLLGLAEVRIINTAVNRANSGALWFIVKTRAFGAFIGYYVVHIHGLGRNGCISIVGVAHGGGHFPMKAGAIAQAPFYATLINGIVRALGFASSTIDALFGDDDGHVGQV